MIMLSVTILGVYFENKLSSSSTSINGVYRKNESYILKSWSEKQQRSCFSRDGKD